MAPFRHFIMPNFFPNPEKVSEAWLAVLSTVSWVDLATWSKAGEGKERAGEGRWGTRAMQGQPGRAPSQEAVWVGKGAAEERVCWACPPSCPPALTPPPSPSRPFCPASVAWSTTC